MKYGFVIFVTFAVYIMQKLNEFNTNSKARLYLLMNCNGKLKHFNGCLDFCQAVE